MEGRGGLWRSWSGESTLPDGEQGARAAGDAALADALEAEDDEQQEEAARGDGRPMLAPHGPALSVQLRRVRLRLREFLATQAAAGMGQKRRKCQKACLEFVAAPQPARAARTHRSRVRHTLWTPPSVPNQLECKSSTPRSLWGCNKLAAERATEGVTNCVYGPRAVSGVSNMRGFDSYRLLTLSLAALMTRISSAMIEGAHTSAGAATLARTVPFWGRFRSP